MLISMVPFLCRQTEPWNGGWQPSGKVAIIVRTPSSKPMVSDRPLHPCRYVFDLNVLKAHLLIWEEKLSCLRRLR